jgi:hypothetical protein
MSLRSDLLADRLSEGARALVSFASGLTDAEWRTPVQPDGRTAGVIVHHVGRMYPLEIQLAQALARGEPVTGVTWEVVHRLNAEHARACAGIAQATALDDLRRNSEAAAAAVRALSDAELDRAAPVSLNADAPLTCQFMLEDHAVRHSYHHLARLRDAVRSWRVFDGRLAGRMPLADCAS